MLPLVVIGGYRPAITPTAQVFADPGRFSEPESY